MTDQAIDALLEAVNFILEYYDAEELDAAEEDELTRIRVKIHDLIKQRSSE